MSEKFELVEFVREDDGSLTMYGRRGDRVYKFEGCEFRSHEVHLAPAEGVEEVPLTFEPLTFEDPT